MDAFANNPFTAFTFIAAPAVLTNAAAIMSLTSANRIARAVDRSRALVAELAKPPTTGPEAELATDIRPFRVREAEISRERAVLLNRAMASFQLAYGSFALATLQALLGAVFGHFELTAMVYAVLGLVVVCMAVGVGGIVRGSALLVHESRMAYRVLTEETAYVLRSIIVPPSVQRMGE